MAFASSGALAEEIYQYDMDQARKNMDRTWKTSMRSWFRRKRQKIIFIHMMDLLDEGISTCRRRSKKPAGMRKK